MKKIICILLMVFSVTTSTFAQENPIGLYLLYFLFLIYNPSLDELSARPQINISQFDFTIQDEKLKQLFDLVMWNDDSEKTLLQIQKLQAKGLDINAKVKIPDTYNNRTWSNSWMGELTALTWAINNRKFQSYKALLEAGADPNEHFSWIVVDRSEQTTQTIQVSLFVYLNYYLCDPEYLAIALRYGLNPELYEQDSVQDSVINFWKNRQEFENYNKVEFYTIYCKWVDTKIQLLIDSGIQLANRRPREYKFHEFDEYGESDLLALSMALNRYDVAWYLISNGASINNVYCNFTQSNDPLAAIRNARLIDRNSPQWQFAKRVLHYYRAQGYPSAFLSADVPVPLFASVTLKDEEGDYYSKQINVSDVELKDLYPKYEDEYWYQYQAQSPSAMALERAKLSEAYYLQKLTTPTPMDDLWRARYYLKIKRYSLALQMLEQSQTKPITSPQAQGYIKDALNELLATGYTAVLSDKLKALLVQR